MPEGTAKLRCVLRLLVAFLLAAAPGCTSRGYVAPGLPRITDLVATPNPARAGDVVEITFTVWDAGGGIGGQWMVSLLETPPAGGRIEPEGNREAIRSSPVRCATRYFTAGPTQARIGVTASSYGDCDGMFCTAPSNAVADHLDVRVGDR